MAGAPVPCRDGLYVDVEPDHLDGAAISFAATDGFGTVEYVGRLAEDAPTLFVDTHSLINDHRSRRELRFARAEFPNG
ncbi:hypothetical protein ACFRCG_36680 [Embleya sp. NPDC056575]|uniref:hypothetical protein n=1 Tax=unclassified Embleya TaxID=2699296 RepID=UPI0036D20381